MDDLRYQVDLLTALNQKLNVDIRMYEQICNNSKAVIVYVNYINDTVRVIGDYIKYFDIAVNNSNDILKFLDFFDEQYHDRLTQLFLPEKYMIKELQDECPSKDGNTWFYITSKLYFDESGQLVDKLITIHNFTKEHEKREELSYLAYYDNLTNLYNRNYFVSKLRDFVDSAAENKTVVSVMLIDIDNFHKISDSRGLIIGDEIIQNLGLFINGLTNENVIASRFNGDLFCIAIYNPTTKYCVDSVYNAIKEYLSVPMKLTDGTKIAITVSVGVAEYPEASTNSLQLINCAEVVMIKSKAKGKNMIIYYDSQIINAFLHDVEVENKLREALFKNRLFLNYQPQFYSDSKKLRGVEALIRWQDTDGTMISPAEFIPISEKNGSIIEIGDFVLDECIKDFMNWKRKFDYDMKLSINISSIQYNRDDFISKILAAINKYGTNPEDLELEITESVLIDDIESMVSKMVELKDYGIKVSLDDFGTGFSSLSYLKGLPIDTLKIDKSFIDNINNDESSQIIVEAIINMSHKLGFDIIAEGVETKEQFDFMKDINCDIIQGYYLGKPVNSREIEELLLRYI